MPATPYDYVIVGAGAAGCAVANRLSADPHTTVLLLEAGGKDWSPLVHMPVGFTKLSGPRYNWEFSTVPQPQLNHREMWYPQGRTLGGSTSINAMIYIRGQREDYEAWATLGNKHWGFEEVLPFFRRAEANERLNDRYHSSVGAVNVTEQVQHNPLSKAFVRAAQELGVPFIADFNGPVQEGVSWYDVTQKGARRESTATAYLKSARKRANLTVQTHALARKILIENGRAVGLEYILKDEPVTVRVDRELILSGGAINSPRLMLLSGIGPGDELRALGIPAAHDLPGVGKNLQDHMDVYLTAVTAPVSYNSSDRPDKAVLAGLQYITTKTGPITASVC
jgi:choline dehydrogenase